MRSLDKGERPLVLAERGEAGKPSTARTCSHEEREREGVKGKQREGKRRGRRRGCSVWN